MNKVDHVVPLAGDPSAARLGEFHQLDTSESAQAHLLECYSGVQFRLSTMARTILEMRWSGRPFEEIAERLRTEDIVNTSPASISTYYGALHQRIAATDGKRRDSDRSYLVRLPILSERRVRAVAAAGKHLFDPIPGSIAVAVLLAALLVWTLTIPHARQHFTPGAFAIAYALFLFSLVVHEFGHASASERFGSHPGAIGFTLYLTFPALFSDVSAAWRLKRWQRVLVDSGGSYFQLLVGAVYVAAYLATHWLPLHIAMLMIVGTTVFNLNPLFKFDGYWIVADALGVTNLSRQTQRIVRVVRARFTGRIVDPLPWPAWTIALLSTYAVVSIAAWSYFLTRLAYALVHQVAFTAHTVRLVAVGAERIDAALAFQLFMTLFGSLVSVYFLSRLAKAEIPKLLRSLRSLRRHDR